MTDEMTDRIARMHEAARALGLDPATIAWPSADARTDDGTAPLARDDDSLLASAPLDDEEWAKLASLLPPEPSQADAMGNRDLLDAVIAVAGRGRAWTDLDPDRISPEAVRKKFARLARQGTWQALHVAAKELGLSPSRLSELRNIATRAQRMTRT